MLGSGFARANVGGKGAEGAAAGFPAAAPARAGVSWLLVSLVTGSAAPSARPGSANSRWMKAGLRRWRIRQKSVARCQARVAKIVRRAA